MNSYVGGPKLRKWYGAPDLLPKDGGLENEDESSGHMNLYILWHFVTVKFVMNFIPLFPWLLPEIDEVRDAVLVTDGDSEIGQVGLSNMKRILALYQNMTMYHSQT